MPCTLNHVVSHTQSTTPATARPPQGISSVTLTYSLSPPPPTGIPHGNEATITPSPTSCLVEEYLVMKIVEEQKHLVHLELEHKVWSSNQDGLELEGQHHLEMRNHQMQKLVEAHKFLVHMELKHKAWLL